MPPVSTSRISLPERYRVVRHVANGGMASVWEAHDELLDRAVAVKLMASHLSEDDRARQRFQREARAAAGLSNHPNVVTIYDVGEHEGRTFMVMELLTGGTLADKLRSGDRIRPQTALRWLREAAAALDAAHEAGVVHRDVKPANMLLDDNGRLAIADFGIARLALEDQLTATGQVLGTAAYISPEQAVGDPASASSDRYALACVAFELLTGRRPFEAENFAAQARAHVEDEPPLASELNPDLPPAVDAVLARGLAKEPEDRWPTSGELLDRLEEALAPAPPPQRAEPRTTKTRLVGGTAPPRRTVAAPVTDGAAPPPAARPRRTGIMLAALAGLLALGVLAAVLLSSGGDDDPKSASDRQQTQEARETATPEATAEETATPEATAEKTATPEPTAEATPEATSTPRSGGGGGGGATDIGQARRLQLQGFNARQAGNYAQALAFSEQALEACGNANQLDPCGYALFEKGVALNRSGRSAEAIPVLEQRLNQYGDNGSGEVQKELRDARKKAG